MLNIPIHASGYVQISFVNYTTYKMRSMSDYPQGKIEMAPLEAVVKHRNLSVTDHPTYK